MKACATHLGASVFFPYKWFNHQETSAKHKIAREDASYSQLRGSNPFVVESRDYVNLLEIKKTTEQSSIELNLWKRPPTVFGKCQYLKEKWKPEQKNAFTDFLRWYYNSQAVLIVARQNLIVFHHNKNICMLKLRSTSPNLTTQIHVSPSWQETATYCKKVKKVLAGGPSVALTV